MPLINPLPKGYWDGNDQRPKSTPPRLTLLEMAVGMCTARGCYRPNLAARWQTFTDQEIARVANSFGNMTKDELLHELDVMLANKFLDEQFNPDRKPSG